MIVLHGVAELAESISEYTLSLDNEGYETISGGESLHDDISISDIDGPSKTDGTSVGEGAKIKIKIETSNIESMTIKSGYCVGSKNTLLSAPSISLNKEEYLEEVSAFMSTGRVDFSLSSVGYNSPSADAAVFTTWIPDSPEGGFPIGDVTLIPSSDAEDKPGTFVLEYETKTVISPPTDCDWYIMDSMELTVDIITKGGAIAKDQKIPYKHVDAPITSGVVIEGSKYLTFDSDIAVMGGWWESSSIPVRSRHVAKSGLSTADAMFRYLIFGSISPSIFSRNIRNMVFTARRDGSVYTLDKVLTNNLYECPDLNGLSIISSGPNIEGSAIVEADNLLGVISINTSDVKTDSGELHIEISGLGTVNSCKFQIKAGFAPTADFLVAAVDARVLYNQITGGGTTVVTGANVDNGLIGFHLFVNGLQEYLMDVALNPIYLVLGIITRGISCALTGNMIDFVFFLYYESVKSILWDTERRIILSGIVETQEHYLASMAVAQTGVDAETRKKMARQWLEMIDSRYMKMSGPNIPRLFLLNIFCVVVPIDMPTSVPYTFGPPMYGVPMGDGIVDTISTPDQILTDEVHAMMKKNAFFSMFRSRMDWAMALGGKLGQYSTSWAWGGTLVVISTGGQHQELYASSDPGYSINGARHTFTDGDVVPDVSIPGEIGEKWNEFKEARDFASRFTYWHGKEVRTGPDAEAAIGAWYGADVPVMHGLSSCLIIDTDNNTVTRNGNDVRDATIYRPNPNVIIAFEKQT